MKWRTFLKWTIFDFMFHRLQLKLETTHAQVKPGSNDFLTIEGDPMMWVGLNVMDKALLLLNNKNVLRKNKVGP